MNRKAKQINSKDKQEAPTTPEKVYFLGMTTNRLVGPQWAGIIIVGGVFLTFCIIMIINSINRAIIDHSEEHAQLVEYRTRLETQSASIKAAAEFLTAQAKSINKRQQLLSRLEEAMTLYAGQNLTKDELERNAASLDSITRSCNLERGYTLEALAQQVNPFIDPKLSEVFWELNKHEVSWDGPVLDPQGENQKWRELCNFCQHELEKANAGLVAILNSETPAVSSPEAEGFLK